VDVQVRLGEVPASLGGDAVRGPKFEARPGALLLKTLYIADYLVTDGNHIAVTPKASASPWPIQNLLFGWVTAGLLQQRGILALHASAVEGPFGAVAFCGDSGVGKSTISALLAARGLRVLDDNIAALAFDENGALVQPGLGYVRLGPDSLARVGESPDPRARIDRASVGPGKYVYALPAQQFCASPRRLRLIYVLKRGAGFGQRQLRGREKVDALRDNTFLLRFARGLGSENFLFRQWLDVCRDVDVVELTLTHDRSPDYLANEIFVQLAG